VALASPVPTVRRRRRTGVFAERLPGRRTVGALVRRLLGEKVIYHSHRRLYMYASTIRGGEQKRRLP
jgi:hypothetical protein